MIYMLAITTRVQLNVLAACINLWCNCGLTTSSNYKVDQITFCNHLDILAISNHGMHPANRYGSLFQLVAPLWLNSAFFVQLNVLAALISLWCNCGLMVA